MSPDIELEKRLAQRPGLDQPNAIAFTFSDSIAGYVENFQRSNLCLTLKTTDGRIFKGYLTSTATAKLFRNLGENEPDCTARIAERLTPGQLVYAHGIFYPEGETSRFEIKSLIFPGESPESFRHEEANWWERQMRALANSSLGSQLEGRQETNRLSQRIYGMSSAYLLTGDERFLEVAKREYEYLRDRLRFYDGEQDILYWYHGVKEDQKLLTSEQGSDYDSIPANEQIQALRGLTQLYRVTGEPQILLDIEKTINLLDKYYKDKKRGGYFSHIDSIAFNPRSERLEKGNNRGKKNWDSIGEHAEAYLINLYLATGEQRYLDLLIEMADTLIEYFPDYEHSPFVQERFYEDWTHDLTWEWQQNRTRVGVDLKLAGILTRIGQVCPKESYLELAQRIAHILPKVGADRQRGGWYGVLERELAQGESHYRFVWDDHKTSWGQEQAILTYLLLHGIQGDTFFLTQAREAASFYHAYFLDHQNNSVFAEVLADGQPYLLEKVSSNGIPSVGSGSPLGLCYLSAVYSNLLISKQPMDFYFKPDVQGLKERILRVAPDLLPTGKIKLTGVWLDGESYQDYETDSLTIRLPEVNREVQIKATLTPVP